MTGAGRWWGVKRYKVSYWDGEDDRDCDYTEDPDGEWVRSEDVLAIEAEVLHLLKSGSWTPWRNCVACGAVPEGATAHCPVHRLEELIGDKRLLAQKGGEGYVD